MARKMEPGFERHHLYTGNARSYLSNVLNQQHPTGGQEQHRRASVRCRRPRAAIGIKVSAL